MADHLVAVHDVIQSERVLKASPVRVFAAWTDQEARKRWEPTPEGMVMHYENFDFRTGGVERSEMRKDGEVIAAFETRFLDMVPQKRIVTSVTVSVGGDIMSCSQNTIEFIPANNGTHLICHEMVVWLHGTNMHAEHQNGWATLLDKLAQEVE